MEQTTGLAPTTEQPAGALSLSEGFEGYLIPDDAERDAALRSALVAVDANVLLNLYRYNVGTREDLLSVLESLGDRLWLPHQVVREFWRNRLGAIGNPQSAAAQVRQGLEKSRDAARRAIEAWAKQVALDDAARTAVLADFELAVQSMLAAVEKGVPGNVDPTTGTKDDPILARLSICLDGKVGRPLSDTDWEAAVAEGTRRVTAEEPPGYRDAAKDDSTLPEGAAGDYLVWMQLMAEGGSRDIDIILVTGDEKEDWWRRHRAALIGPRTELFDEYWNRGKRRFYLFTPTELLQRSDALSVTVAEASVEDAARLRTDVVAPAEWTSGAVKELLRRLDAEGRVQADVIREAARSGGMVARHTVFEIGGYDEDRMLRGFTRPTARITEDLQNEGFLDGPVVPMLVPLYQGGVIAAAFKIPDEVVDLLATDA